jgi:hypothetical protein
MTAPTGLTLTFDQPSYPPDAIVTATLSGTGANTTATDRTLNGTLTDEATGEVSDVTGTFVVDLPNRLAGAVGETDAPITWTPGKTSQVGQEWSGEFTATAG